MKTRWPYHEEDEIAAVAQVLRSGRTNFWQGGPDGEESHGQAFEREFAAFTGAAHALTVSNGTTALECALHAMAKNTGYDPLGWAYEGSGQQEVIVPCRTFMATASACVNTGYRPVLADIAEATLNVTVETLDARRTPRTRGVIVVHFAGRPCEMSSIMEWAHKHKLWVIEDCAHAHGATIDCVDIEAAATYKRHVGTYGNIGTFSFCVGKIMSTGGEGGMCITNDAALHKHMAAYRDHGRYQMVGAKDMTQFQYTVEEFGSNLRMTEMQAVIGRIQLKKLPVWIYRRRRIAERYNAVFGTGQAFHPGHSFYLYIFMCVDRDRILSRLNERGIPARIGGCPNIGRERAFLAVHDCPNADRAGEYTLALPIYPTMTDEDVDAVITEVSGVLKSENSMANDGAGRQ